MNSERSGSDAFGYFCMGRHFRFFASLHRESDVDRLLIVFQLYHSIVESIIAST